MRSFTKEHKDKISNALKGNQNAKGKKRPLAQLHTRKKVIQFTLEGEIINIFESVSEATRITGVPQPDISLVCHGKRVTAKGYKWRFAHPYQ
jgi:hypothetical protein